MAAPNEDPEPPSTGTVDERELLPVGRDTRFVYRLVALMLVAVIGAAFVGAKLQGWGAACGAGLIRPGSTVIPPRR